MSFRDFWKPRRQPNEWHARMAVQLASVDPSWAKGDNLPPAPRPHPLFSNLTESEIDIALAMMHGGVEYDPQDR